MYWFAFKKIKQFKNLLILSVVEQRSIVQSLTKRAMVGSCCKFFSFREREREREWEWERERKRESVREKEREKERSTERVTDNHNLRTCPSTIRNSTKSSSAVRWVLATRVLWSRFSRRCDRAKCSIRRRLRYVRQISARLVPEDRHITVRISETDHAARRIRRHRHRCHSTPRARTDDEQVPQASGIRWCSFCLKSRSLMIKD